MARYVIDAPTLLHLVEHDLRPHPSHRLVAPNSLRSDAMDLLLQQVNAGERVERDALRLHERMTAMKVRLLGDRVSRATAWRIARERGWNTVREAEYLAVARLQADALVTVDPSFSSLAAASVPVAPLDALLSE